MRLRHPALSDWLPPDLAVSLRDRCKHAQGRRIFCALRSERLSKCNKLSFLAACSIWVIPWRGQMA
ncbi:protein of unknown function [Cupriavidus taiwanensis]|nr:protein of unknown function [Cupriavidus taiwanensis]